jgi:hypothetical protein
MKGLVIAKFRITDRSLEELRSAGVPEEILQRLAGLKDQEGGRRGKFVGLLQQTVGYGETALYRQVILKASAIRRQRRVPRKKPWWRRLKKPSIGQYLLKVFHSTILSGAILVAGSGLDFLYRWLYAGSVNPWIDFIKGVDNLASAGLFVIFLTVKVLHNLGIVET